jgi:hypothetical protein
MFTISYAIGMAISVVSGALWDATGIAALTFLPIALCAVWLSLSALLLRAQNRLR